MPNVPILDLSTQNFPLKRDILSAIESIIESGQFILGHQVEELEQSLAQYLGCTDAIAVSSGTDALLMALMAIGTDQSHSVITTPFSFHATGSVIGRLGAQSILIDIEERTFMLDAQKVSDYLKKCSAETINKIKAIIVVHLYGQSIDMDSFLEISNAYDIPIIEDAAQSIGSKWDGDKFSGYTGALGAIGCFSFYPTKNLGAMGDAGMVTTNNPELASKLRKIRSHGSGRRYYHDMVGGNFRMDAIQAAVLRHKLPHLDGWIAERRNIAQLYTKKLQDIKHIATPYAEPRSNHTWHQYVITTPFRDELRAWLEKHHIQTEIYYPIPFHLQKSERYLNYRHGDFPYAEKLAKQVLALPIYPGLATESINLVADKIAEFGK